MMRVLLLSAYEAVSHRYWANSLMAEVNEVDWTLLSLPPRYFSWRIRGNPLSWWLKEYERLNQPYDVVLATSMVDIATLVGLFGIWGEQERSSIFTKISLPTPNPASRCPR